jgi:arylsulfatase A-like enzyme/tetratricopeptide (TPR) repeat protein
MRLTRFLPVAPFALLSCSSPPDHLNLVLVSVDTLRADHLSCYGSETTSTPGFDRIAREGLLFENAASVAPTTLPAHASLLTGTSPFGHWVHDNVGFRLRQDLPTLASTLKARGYRTGSFIGSFVLDKKFGLAQGFDVYSDETPETDRGLRERRGEKVLEEALGWIGSENEAPFFAFLHFFDPHRPYEAPPPFAPQVTGLEAAYRGEVSYVDSLLQRLLAFLDARGLSESTVLVVTADHGESLGEHGEDTHGFFLYQSTLHVPLLIRAPGIRHGQRASALVRTIDIAPTALELLGVEPPSSFEGVGFVSATGEVKAREVEAYAETFVPRLHYGWSELRSLRRGNWKLILAPRSELYDLDSDPGEERNRIDEEENEAPSLLVRLEELPGPENVRPESLDPGTLASLHALGYLGGSAPMPAPERSFTELSDPKDKLAVYKELNELTAISDPTPADVERLALVLEQEPRSTKALSMYGSFLLDLRRPGDARKAFERLLEIQPESYDGHYGLGRALASLGESDAARGSFEKARALDPRSAFVYSRLSALEKSQGNLEASERWLREGITMAPGRLLYQDLADLLLSSDRGAEVSRMADEWRGTGADAAAAYAHGQLLASQRNAEGALIELERAVSLAPEDDNIEQALANTLSGLGRFDEAKLHYEAILHRSPCYLGALTNLGAVHERQGNVDEGIRSYERAIGCDPEYANAYRNLGGALARKGDLRRALEVLRKAKRLAPGDQELDAAIAELESLKR